jgi:exoribonuclease-2
MFLLFEEAGKIVAGRILSEAETSAHVELDSGKRVKVKASNSLLRFDKPAPAVLLQAAEHLSQTIELDMAWEFAPEEEFGFAELARDYFSDQAGADQQAGMLLCLFNNPHYFRRAGKGRFRKASAEVLAQALAAIEKKKQIAEQIAAWSTELAQGSCPAPVREQLFKILFKPDKNAPEYKAVVDAARATQTAPLALLQQAGAIDSPYQFHWKRFVLENFPKGTGFPAVEAPRIDEAMPLAAVQAFSIDDSSTTEIDDALSLQGLGTDSVTLGIHIAAPALAVAPDSAIDALGRSRLSTVYMPGHKITMLPDAVVQHYTLQEGRPCPAVSLYVQLHAQTLEIQHTETRIEQVPIAHNLRHDQLEQIVTTEWLSNPDLHHSEAPDPLPQLRPQLAFLFQLAQKLKNQREQVRGKPETFSRPDYQFQLVCDKDTPLQGDETVQISPRLRGSPLDLIVAEAMILANSTWGSWLSELGVPAIYRSQASMAPGVKVRMGTKALPHAGIGVPCYAWSTSPLRRYTDLVNQWQIIACARHGRTAALAAPFKPKDAVLFSIISSFDAAYSAYNSHQNAMERFWTLQYIRQNQITELIGTVIKDNLVRTETLPLVLPALGAQTLARGVRVRVQLGSIDLIALDVKGSVLEVLDAPADANRSMDAEEGSDDEVAGPIAIAMDVNEVSEPATENRP